MIKKIFSFFKKVVVSGFLLYGFNLIVAPLNISIPLNFITVLTISILGLPALFGFLVILLAVF